MIDDDRVALAAEAFLYGFPLLFDLQQVARFTREGIGSLGAAPFNAFSHATDLAGPADTFVSINNDTVYSIAQVDVSGGPVRLQVPDTSGRYYVLQFVDAWTNNFAYIGHRATGTAAGSYLLVAPGWDGSPAAGETVIRFPTSLATIVGRWAVDGEDDLGAVADLQSRLVLTPPEGAGAGLPLADPAAARDLVAFEQMRLWIQAFPPAERDVAYQQRFAPLGLLDTDTPYADAGGGLAQALVAGRAAAEKQMEDALQQGGSPEVNGWKLTYHVFAYNLDFFEVGALDDSRWKLPDSNLRYLVRALSARGGLWGNHGYGAAYAMTYDDGAGRPLDGAARYEMRFSELPPVRAFWSITMYDLPDYYLVENPIGRYSIGDRTPGLRYAGDGSLTITMQREQPASAEARANWLPTPPGPFRPILRLYEPGDAVFDGTYELPPIEHVD
jgi:hypothetical protein